MTTPAPTVVRTITADEIRDVMPQEVVTREKTDQSARAGVRLFNTMIFGY